jgi:hypothetical protein
VTAKACLLTSKPAVHAVVFPALLRSFLTGANKQLIHFLQDRRRSLAGLSYFLNRNSRHRWTSIVVGVRPEDARRAVVLQLKGQ